MKEKVFLGIQVLAGVMLVVFGLNKFLYFIPMAPPPGAMTDYMSTLFATGFIFPIIAVVEIVTGVAFVLNKFASLMAIVLAPIMINALLAHLFMDQAGIGGAAFIVIALMVVMFKNKERYKEIFKA